MKLETRFSCGDKAWCFEGARSVLRTIGQVRVAHTASEGINHGRVEAGCGIQFSNYVAQSAHEETYMCVETGIGSGTVYRLGESIFATQNECDTANAARIAERKAELEERTRWERRQLLSEEPTLRARLAQIEQAKATSAPEAA